MKETFDLMGDQMNFITESVKKSFSHNEDKPIRDAREEEEYQDRLNEQRAESQRASDMGY